MQPVTATQTASLPDVRLLEDRRKSRMLRLLAGLGIAFLVIGLFGRVMAFPLTHDEQLHIPAARFILREPLYGTLGYTHLPGLPLLLGGLYAATGVDHLLQTGRLLIFLCWMATATVLWLTARRHGGDGRLAISLILVLGAGALLGPTGMLVTNNFLPVPFALLGVHLFIAALDRPEPRPATMFGAGLAVGFAVTLKISYVFLLPPIAIAALLAPRGLSIGQRVGLILLPLIAGGVVGVLPALVVFLSDPHTLFAHTVRYFTTGHRTYWQHSTDPKAMSMAAKILVAEDVWFAQSGLLASILVGATVWVLGRQDWRTLRWWPIPFVASLVALAAVGSFAPTPAFPQYYEPPVPFLIMLFLLLRRQLEPRFRAWVQPLVGTAAVLALAIIVPRILPDMAAAVRPARWTGNVLHAQGEYVRATLAAAHRSGKVATLSPIVALEGGLPIYPEFAVGPFLYRVADYLPAADRSSFRTTSPRELPGFLDADPPAAIVTGHEAELDPAFVNYARTRKYVPVATGDAEMQLFIRP